MKTQHQNVALQPGQEPAADELRGGGPPRALGLNEFFWASAGRVDRWRSLHRLAKAIAAATAPQVDRLRTETADLLAALAPNNRRNSFKT